MISTEPRAAWWLSRQALLVSWLLSGVLLLVALGGPPVQRTQEARVLETARQMRGAPDWRGWLVPMLNGNLRLKKPPLTYWLAAAGYRISGVNEAAGRLPTALAGWLALGLTFAVARWLFDVRTGFISAACLLSSYMFFRHVRLAETDAPAMLFVTLACFSIWKGAVGAPGWQGGGNKGIESADSQSVADETPSPAGRQALWFHVAALGVALALLSKGGPAVFPVLFLLALVIDHGPALLWRFVRSGAIVTFLAVGVPWFAYVAYAAGSKSFAGEILKLLRGDDHGGHFYQYFPQLFQATAPWCAVMPVALFEASRRFKHDQRLRGLLLWVLAIFLPLCVAGNKQFHYLLSLMPPLMILTGWIIERSLWRREGPRATFAERPLDVRPLLAATVVVTLLAAPGVLVAAKSEVGAVRVMDCVAAALVAAGGAAALIAWIRRGASTGTLTMLAAWAVLMPLLVGIWAPSIKMRDTRWIAAHVSESFGDGPYCFYGYNYSLGLCFNLRSQMPLLRTKDELISEASARPGLVAIVQTKSNTPRPTLPPGFVARREPLRAGDQVFEFYKRDDAALPSP